MDGQKKGVPTELDNLVESDHQSQTHVVDSRILSGKLTSNSAKNSAYAQTHASVTPKKELLKDSSDISSGSHHPTVLLNSSQTYPKKKGGFVITSVKDNVDGDESADDLDESHASYSDISYSRTTDIDHDQESTASEDTLNLTVQDGIQQSGNANPSHAVNNAHAVGQVIASSDQAQHHQSASHTAAGASPYKPKVERKQALNTLPSASLDSPQELPNDSALDSIHPVKHLQASNVMASHGTGISEPVGGNTLPQTSHANENQQTSLSKSATNNSKAVSISPSSVSVSTTSSVPSASGSNTIAKGSSSSNVALPKGGSRVYKVVKRETGPPVGRDIGRWLCFDYGDGQTPNLGFVAQSASDSRLSFPDQLQLQLANQLAPSMSTTSVPSSASAYNLQHSDSASSVQRDGYPHGISTGSNSAVQHSASTSSVNHDLEARKLLRSTKSAVSEILNYDDSRSSGRSLSEQELLKNVMQSSGDLPINPEHDDEREGDPKSTGRIDNKIETAMDLVKKHLMMAVRDEVDELKEKIVELTMQNEALRGILHPDQIAALQPHQSLSSSGQSLAFQMKATSQNQQMPLYQQQPSGLPSSPATLDHANQPPLSHASTGLALNQKQSFPLNLLGFSLLNPNPSSLQRGQSGPSQQNQAIPLPQNLPEGIPSAISHPQPTLSLSQQQMLQKQQQVVPQQPVQVSRTANQQPVFPPGVQPVPPQQQQFLGNNSQAQPTHPVQLTQPQMQALFQVAYQQLTNPMPPQPGQIPQGFQPSQKVMQQPGLPPLAQQQPPLQPAQFQPYQQQVPLQQPAQFQSAPLPQATPPISQAQQGQFQATQQGAARTPAQSSQSAPALPRQQPTAPNPTAPLPSVHGAVPNTLHGQQQQHTSVQSANLSAPSGTTQGGVGAVVPEQKLPQS